MEEAYSGEVNYEQFLVVLLKKEYLRRVENRNLNRVRSANFPLMAMV